jgi:glycosyltransferase involved in cell wall biosynthesis
MKVLIASGIHHVDKPSGLARIVSDEAALLTQHGHEVWVLAEGTPTSVEHEFRDDVHLLRYCPARVAAWNPRRAWLHQRSARAVLERHLPSVDLVHGHLPLTFLAAHGLYLSSARYCYTIHSPARSEMKIVWNASGGLRRLTAPLGLALLNRMERQCLYASSTVTALSDYTIRCVEDLHGSKIASRIQKIPGWVDVHRFSPRPNVMQLRRQLGWSSESPLLFTLRRLAPRMGLENLLAAFALLRRSDIRFHAIIGGGGPLETQLKQQCTDLGLDEAVTFVGRIPDAELPLAYAACDAFLLPTSELECFGLIALEALSSGKPVLATPVGAIPEIIQSIEPRWLAASASAPDLAELIGKYLGGQLPEHSTEELRRRMGQSYDVAALLPEYVKLILGERNGRTLAD